MDVCIYFFGRLQLHNQVNFGNVQTSSSDVRSYQTFELTFFKALESDLSLLLRDVSMEHLGLALEIGLEKDLVGFFFSLCKNNSSAMTSTIEVDYVGNNCVSVIVRTVEGEMLDGLGGPDFGVFDKVYKLSVG